MSETPRTDEQELAYMAEDGSTYVHTTFARKLEREIAELLKDAQRLDWLQSNDLTLHSWEEGDVWGSKGAWTIREFIDREME